MNVDAKLKQRFCSKFSRVKVGALGAAAALEALHCMDRWNSTHVCTAAPHMSVCLCVCVCVWWGAKKVCVSKKEERSHSLTHSLWPEIFRSPHKKSFLRQFNVDALLSCLQYCMQLIMPSLRMSNKCIIRMFFISSFFMV